MPKVSFCSVSNPTPVAPIPAGEYVCQFSSIERTQTKRGDEMWRLRLAVHEGAYAGRTIQDNLVFSQEAMPRVKLLCEALGLDTNGELDLVPDMIKGGICLVRVIVEEYQGKEKNKVRFDGYAPIVEGEM